MLFSDYGVNDGNLNVRFWDSNQPKDHWRDVEFFGKSNASNDQVKDTFFGQNSEKWTNPGGRCARMQCHDGLRPS